MYVYHSTYRVIPIRGNRTLSNGMGGCERVIGLNRFKTKGEMSRSNGLQDILG